MRDPASDSNIHVICKHLATTSCKKRANAAYMWLPVCSRSRRYLFWVLRMLLYTNYNHDALFIQSKLIAAVSAAHAAAFLPHLPDAQNDAS